MVKGVAHGRNRRVEFGKVDDETGDRIRYARHADNGAERDGTWITGGRRMAASSFVARSRASLLAGAESLMAVSRRGGQ